MNERFNIFKKLINTVSTQILIHQLPPIIRWHLMLDVLRGTAPFRGGRIRDYPLSEQRSTSERLIKLLSSDIRTGTPRKYFPSGNYSLFEQITTLMLLEIATRTHPTYFGGHIDEDEKYTALIIALSSLLFNEENDQKNTALQMGVSLNEWTKLRKKKYINKLFNDSATLSVFANYNYDAESFHGKRIELEKHFGVDQRMLDFYDNITIDVIYIKTRNVQAFLDKCKTHFMLRGASFWCSQIMSYVRDIICKFNQSSLQLVIDSDSIIIIAGLQLPSQKHLAKTLRDAIIDQENNQLIHREFIFKRYPRLINLWRHCDLTHTSMLPALPNIGLDINRSKSLLSMAMDGQNFSLKPASRWTDNNTVCFNSTRNTTEDALQTCSGVTGELAFRADDYKVPKWYNAQSKDEKYGCAASIFSLADITFRHQTLLEFQSWIENKINRSISFNDYSKNIAKDLCLTDKITYLKLDGDSVGRIFSSAPFFSRPTLSHLLEDSMIQALLITVADIIEKFNFDLIPVNLLYLGGDDLFLSFPSDLENDFLKLFDFNLGSLFYNQMITFTFAATRLTNINYGYKSAEHDQLLMKASQFLNPLLKLSKSFFKDEANLSDNNSINTDLSYRDYMSLINNADYYHGLNLRGITFELTTS